MFFKNSQFPLKIHKLLKCFARFTKFSKVPQKFNNPQQFIKFPKTLQNSQKFTILRKSTNLSKTYNPPEIHKTHKNPQTSQKLTILQKSTKLTKILKSSQKPPKLSKFESSRPHFAKGFRNHQISWTATTRTLSPKTINKCGDGNFVGINLNT
jgi:hypothetical protein